MTIGRERNSNVDYLEMESGNATGVASGRTTERSGSNRRLDMLKQQRTMSTQRINEREEGLISDEERKEFERAESSDSTADEVYVVRQEYGYLSILFSLAQTVILIIMMWQCGVAPLNINPMVGPYPDALSEWGAKNAVNILDDGEWWRLVTPILLHAGVIHLVCNVAVQLETGAFFEREWGSLTWLIIYISSAFGSSILSVISMPGQISVGSAGAVMGLFGGKLAEVFCRACESKKTVQGRVGHQVRKEQLGGVLCAVTLVMAFSFIPFGECDMYEGVDQLFVLCRFLCRFRFPIDDGRASLRSLAITRVH